jgi:hypothetical protein
LQEKTGGKRKNKDEIAWEKLRDSTKSAQK